MKFYFYVKNDGPAIKCSESLKETLENLNQEITDEKDCDVIVIIGGDGTFLSAARKFAKYQKLMVGINLGRLGFLTEIPKEKATDMIKLIIDNKFTIINRMMIDVFLEDKFLGSYLNDAVLARASFSRLIDIEVYQNHSLIIKLRADGIIVSTPTGSTAYALSAGGPILTPELQNILLVPICPHTISIRPIVLSAEVEISLKLIDKTKEAYLTLDGQEFFSIQKDQKIIIKKSNIFCKTINFENIDFFDVVRDKLSYS